MKARILLIAAALFLAAAYPAQAQTPLQKRVVSALEATAEAFDAKAEALEAEVVAWEVSIFLV